MVGETSSLTRSLTRLSHITFHASRLTRGTGLAQEAALKAPCNR